MLRRPRRNYSLLGAILSLIVGLTELSLQALDVIERAPRWMAGANSYLSGIFMLSVCFLSLKCYLRMRRLERDRSIFPPQSDWTIDDVLTYLSEWAGEDVSNVERIEVLIRDAAARGRITLFALRMDGLSFAIPKEQLNTHALYVKPLVEGDSRTYPVIEKWVYNHRVQISQTLFDDDAHDNIHFCSSEIEDEWPRQYLRGSWRWRYQNFGAWSTVLGSHPLRSRVPACDETRLSTETNC